MGWSPMRRDALLGGLIGGAVAAVLITMANRRWGWKA